MDNADTITGTADAQRVAHHNSEARMRLHWERAIKQLPAQTRASNPVQQGVTPRPATAQGMTHVPHEVYRAGQTITAMPTGYAGNPVPVAVPGTKVFMPGAVTGTARVAGEPVAAVSPRLRPHAALPCDTKAASCPPASHRPVADVRVTVTTGKDAGTIVWVRDFRKRLQKTWPALVCVIRSCFGLRASSTVRVMVNGKAHSGHQ